MTVIKTAAPLILLMFTVLCALPAAAVVGVIPSAFAQEEDEQDQFPDDTNTQIGVPISDQDQGAANLGANLAANVDVEHIIEETRPTLPEEEQPEFVTFCFLSGFVLLEEPTLLCFDTMEDCKLGEGFLGPVVDEEECKGFVTPPPDSGDCEVTREQGQPPEFECTVPQP